MSTNQRRGFSVVTTKARLARGGAGVREEGCAISIGEFRPGVNGIAAPIWSAEGKVVGSVTFAGDEERLSPARLPKLAAEVKTAGVQISEALGFRLI